MSWNNVIPFWMLGEFHKAFSAYENKEITIEEFYNRIKDIEDVPQSVKENWRQACNADNIC